MRHYPPREPRSAAGHWSKHRDRATQARFRKRLIDQAGGAARCQCGCGQCVYTPVQAHHDGPDHGRLLCRPCHKHEDPYAR